MAPRQGFYVPVRWKFVLALLAGMAWAGFAVYAADLWIRDLGTVIGATAAHLVIYGIAVVPGFMNAFLIVSLLLVKGVEKTTAHSVRKIET